MARGRKNLTLEENLERINNAIDECNTTLNALQEEKKEVEAQIKMKKLEELEQLIAESGKSMDEIKALLMK